MIIAYIILMIAVCNSYTLTNAIMAVVDKSFVYELVSELPPEAAEWRSYAEQVLKKSDPSMHLTPEQKTQILHVDNSDWKLLPLKHWCLDRNRCPAQCNGSAVRAKQNMKAVIALSILCNMEKPLLYRWKGFERANAYVLRARRQHDLLRRGLQNSWLEVCLAPCALFLPMYPLRLGQGR